MNDKINVTPHDEPDAVSAEIQIIAKWEKPLPVKQGDQHEHYDVSALLIIHSDRVESQKDQWTYLKKCAALGMKKHYAYLNLIADDGGKFYIIAPTDDGGWYVHGTYYVKS